jgi:hypothetical protein
METAFLQYSEATFVYNLVDPVQGSSFNISHRLSSAQTDAVKNLIALNMTEDLVPTERFPRARMQLRDDWMLFSGFSWWEERDCEFDACVNIYNPLKEEEVFRPSFSNLSLLSSR